MNDEQGYLYQAVRLVAAIQAVAVELRIANTLETEKLPHEYGFSSSHPYDDYEGWLRVLREQFESDLN